MALQLSGLITMDDIRNEFGGVDPISLSQYYRNGAHVPSSETDVPESGLIALSDFYGAEASAFVGHYTGSTPYGGTAPVVPESGSLVITASEYDEGGQDVAYYDTTTGNEPYSNDGGRTGTDVDHTGANNIGWTESGEWLAYTFEVTTAGTFEVESNLARGGTGDATYALEFYRPGENTPYVTTPDEAFPSTGAWSTYATDTISNIVLEQGICTMRFKIVGLGLDINQLTITQTAVAATGGTVVTPSLGTPTKSTGESSTGTVTIPSHTSGGVFLIGVTREGYNETEPSITLSGAVKRGEYGLTSSAGGSRSNTAIFTYVGDGTTTGLSLDISTTDAWAATVLPVDGVDPSIIGTLVVGGGDQDGTATSHQKTTGSTTGDNELAVFFWGTHHEGFSLSVHGDTPGWTLADANLGDNGNAGADLFTFTKDMDTAGAVGDLKATASGSWEGAYAYISLAGGVSSGGSSGGSSGDSGGSSGGSNGSNETRMYTVPAIAGNDEIGYEIDRTVEPTVLTVDMELTSGAGSPQYEATRSDISGPRMLCITRGGRNNLPDKLQINKDDVYIIGQTAGSLPEFFGDRVDFHYGDRGWIEHVRMAGAAQRASQNDGFRFSLCKNNTIKNITLMDTADEAINWEGDDNGADAENNVAREILGIKPHLYNPGDTAEPNHNYGPYFMDYTKRSGLYNSGFLGYRRRCAAWENPATGAVAGCIFQSGGSAFVTASPFHDQAKSDRTPLTYYIDVFGNIFNWVPSSATCTTAIHFGNDKGVTAYVFQENNLISDGVWGSTDRTSLLSTSQTVALAQRHFNHNVQVANQATLWSFIEDRAGAWPAQRATEEQDAINEAKNGNIVIEYDTITAVAPPRIDSGFDPSNFTGLAADGIANIWHEVDRLNGVKGGVTLL